MPTHTNIDLNAHAYKYKTECPYIQIPIDEHCDSILLSCVNKSKTESNRTDIGTREECAFQRLPDER